MTEPELFAAYGVPPGQTVAGLLERAALEGRPEPDEDPNTIRPDHAPVPPALRCQRCGRWLSVVRPDESSWLEWRHADDVDG